MPGRTDSRGRLIVLLIVLVIAAGSLVSRLAWWQVAQRADLAAMAVAQTEVSVERPSDRGTIYDRSGTVVLATTVDRWRITGSPDQLTLAEQSDVATRLATILGLAGPDAQAMADKMASNKPYVVLATDVPESTAAQIRSGLADGSLQGLGLEAQPVRVYPQAGGATGTTLAAQLLGFVNQDGVGQYGVEQRYQDVLAGQPELAVADRSATNDAINGSERVVQAGTPGADLRLTIDASLQLAVEQEIMAAWVADRAKSVSAVVLDPYTGAVLAEASYPSYDANDYKQVAATDPSRFMDPVVSSVYEPGSVFKMLTATAALTNHVVTPKTIINDTGTMRLDGGQARISDADRRPMGHIPFEDIVAYSRNVGAARVALELGKTTTAAATVLHDTWLRLGFGAPTGIDVAGEVAGLVRDPAISTWRQIDLANGSFGQGVAVTPIQLASAYSAMVNGGMAIQPHVVEAIGSQQIEPASRGRVIDPAVATQLVGLMKHVVTTVPFYRDRTLVPGYVVGGKTGTAQIWDPKKNDWKVDIFNYSFVGFIGRSKPDLVVAVRISEGTPTIAKVGELEMPVMSFELFRRIATDAMSTLDLPSQIVTVTANR